MRSFTQVRGWASIAIACAGLVSAVVSGIVVHSRIGGDMGWIAALGTSVRVAAVFFACGSLVGLLSLLRGPVRTATLVGLIGNLLGAMVVLWLLWSGGAFE